MSTPNRFCVCTYCAKDFERAYNISKKRASKSQFCSRECRSRWRSVEAAITREARIWALVDIREAHECWPWKGRRNAGGYGEIDIGGRPHVASRVVYKIVTGEEPPQVCHRCDNPPCCNPKHLFGGTAADNFDDMRAKGRWNRPRIRRGIESNKVKLSEADVLDIFRSEESNAELGRRYGITKEAIRYIKIGKNWSWLTGGLDV